MDAGAARARSRLVLVGFNAIAIRELWVLVMVTLVSVLVRGGAQALAALFGQTGAKAHRPSRAQALMHEVVVHSGGCYTYSSVQE